MASIPDDIGSQKPPVLLQAQSEPPWESHEIPGLDAPWRRLICPCGEEPLFCVHVAEIDPERPAINKHTRDLAEDFYELLDVLLGRPLLADFLVLLGAVRRQVIPQAVIRGTRDTRMNALRR